MSLVPRSHVVTFRLTREEHDRFRELCSTHGLGSISEMIRAAVNAMFPEPARVLPSGVAESRFAELEKRVDSLAADVQKMAKKPAQPSRCSAT